MHRNKSGFTVVELLIVIVVIGILATIISVSFNGAQQRGRDTRRIHDVDAIATALTAIGTRGDSSFAFNTTGAGANAATVGFIETGPPTSGYALSIKDWLAQSGYFSRDIAEPQFVYNTRDYAVTLCKDSDYTNTINRRVVMARLENPPSKTMDQQLAGNGCSSTDPSDNFWYKVFQAAPFSMNYGVMVDVH